MEKKSMTAISIENAEIGQIDVDCRGKGRKKENGRRSKIFAFGQLFRRHRIVMDHFERFPKGHFFFIP
jgi:hypothetical protein